MSNLAFFTSEFEGSQIRVTEDRRFSVFDVLVAFGVCDSSNASKVFKRIADKHSDIADSVSSHKFSGRGQRETPVASMEVIEEILKRLKSHPAQVALTNDRFYPRTEDQIISVLIEAFNDLKPIEQFRVHGYRIDLYLAAANIAVEIDEYGHQQYDSKADNQREQSIKSALGCSFVRCDSYAADFNLGRVISQIRGLL